MYLSSKIAISSETYGNMNPKSSFNSFKENESPDDILLKFV